MHRVVVAEVKQETATFNPAPTTYDGFHVTRGANLTEKYRGTSTELAGAFDVFSGFDVEVLPAMAADSVSGGRIIEEDLQRLLAELISAIESFANVDGVYLSLHGAMAGDHEVDPEGYLLSEVRKRLGDRPLVASLDLHAIITDRMLAAVDALVPFHTYPHVDQYETGSRSARLLLQLLSQEVQPTTARVELPMLVRGDELITETGRFGEAIRRCQAIESRADGLVAGVIIGNAFTDVPDLQSNVLVTTDNAPELARELAEDIGQFMWTHRNEFQAALTPLPEAISMAAATDGLTIFSDAADATASGASGDSNLILAALLEPSCQLRAAVPIVDGPAARVCHEAGVGTTLELPLGGTLDAGRFSPLTVTARVKSLHDGRFCYENGTWDAAGNVAVLESGSVSILVVERPVYFVGQRVFQAHGLDPQDFDVVVVKSPNGFRPYFESVAARIVPVDVAGSTSANLKSLPFEHCVRPIFPLDDNVADPPFLRR